ncbi:family 20 glycosylhydrolase [Sulfuriroseicoccus oceanibius]|uniref:beta-N-acetylhexosaminidase n=1 Tax=Sulfuriroseicoccus oceanibius TaxID=2707525 RepID=A0A6B3LB05_9BACT|nr:family 20 glycosylhydrolase [Sulfuriroseicoccus oceanibius]QQL45311.1 beta-N-acetylhexosaminidase [Sulfuriroseicoccus oceanibius]
MTCRVLVFLFLWAGVVIAQASDSGWSLPTPPAGTAKRALIPYPVEVDWQHADREVAGVAVAFGAGIPERARDWLGTAVERVVTEFGLTKADVTGETGFVVRFAAGRVEGAHLEREAYALEFDHDGVVIVASHFRGWFNGVQTLRQLIYQSDGRWMVAGCAVRDWPAFGIRGVMLDVGRNYLSPGFIKRQVDRLAGYKINTLHLHLTEDAAWRLEIKKYPQLTAAEFHWKTRQPGRYYTQEEMRELIAYCARRGVTVIPEIDMPGHSEAFKRAMGFDMQSEAGVAVLREVIDEVASLFPSRYLHLGSDEVRIRMKEFMPRMVAHARRRGKDVVVWDPGHLPDRQVVKMHWGDHTGQKVDPSMRHIDTTGFYMDWIDAQSGVYQYFFQQPCDVRESNRSALGAITCVWTDGALSGEDRLLIQYPFYPCMLTFAERLWRGAAEERADLFAKLPQPGSAAHAAFAEFEGRLTAHRDLYFQEVPFAYVKQSHIPWKLIGPFDHRGRNDTSFEPERVIKESYQQGGRTLRWEDEPAWGSAIHLRHFYSVFNLHRKQANPDYWPATMSHRVGDAGGTCYALSYIFSPEPQQVGVMFGIGGMWGHSGGYRSARAPRQGEWDFSGGDLWINDERIAPPRWSFESLPWGGWGKGRIEEAPLTEEGYFFRPPVQVALKQGWNKVLVRVPFGWWQGDDGQRKWFFNCVPVRWDGIHYREVDGLRYAVEPQA